MTTMMKRDPSFLLLKQKMQQCSILEDEDDDYDDDCDDDSDSDDDIENKNPNTLLQLTPKVSVRIVLQQEEEEKTDNSKSLPSTGEQKPFNNQRKDGVLMNGKGLSVDAQPQQAAKEANHKDRHFAKRSVSNGRSHYPHPHSTRPMVRVISSTTHPDGKKVEVAHLALPPSRRRRRRRRPLLQTGKSHQHSNSNSNGPSNSNTRHNGLAERVSTSWQGVVKRGKLLQQKLRQSLSPTAPKKENDAAVTPKATRKVTFNMNHQEFHSTYNDYDHYPERSFFCGIVPQCNTTSVMMNFLERDDSIEEYYHDEEEEDDYPYDEDDDSEKETAHASAQHLRDHILGRFSCGEEGDPSSSCYDDNNHGGDVGDKNVGKRLQDLNEGEDDDDDDDDEIINKEDRYETP